MNRKKTGIVVGLWMAYTVAVSAQSVQQPELPPSLQYGLFKEQVQVEKLTFHILLQSVPAESHRNEFRYKLEDYKARQLTDSIAYLLNRLTQYYKTRGLYQAAHSSASTAIFYAQQKEEGRRYLASAFRDIGCCLQAQGDYQGAMKYYFLTLAISKSVAHSLLQPEYIYCDINAAIADSKNEYRFSGNGINTQNRSLYYLDKAEVIARKKNNIQLLNTILLNKGINYGTWGDSAQSAYYLNAAYRLAMESGQQLIAYRALMRLGHLKLRFRDADSALQYLRLADSLLPTGETELLFRIVDYLFAGELYYTLRNYPKALTYFSSALDSATKYNMPHIVTKAHFNLNKLYHSLHKKDLAYHHLSAYIRIKDSLTSSSVLNNMQQLDIKYRTAQKEKELVGKQLIIARQKENIVRKNAWLAVIISGCTVLIVIILVLYRSYRQKQRRQAEQIHAMRQEQEISNLKSMIHGEEKERSRLARELHDGIMVQLSVVNMNLKTALAAGAPASRESVQQLEKTMHELRQTAHNLMPDILLAEGLSEALLYFCESLNSSSTTEIFFESEGKLPRLQPETELSIYRIVQELAQNILKHAKATQAIVQLLMAADNLLVITIEDNGIGFDSDNIKNNPGMGLRSIPTRVMAMQGTMALQSKPGQGTSIYLEFDIRGMIQKEEAYAH